MKFRRNTSYGIQVYCRPSSDGQTDGRTFLHLDSYLGTYSVRKSSQESVITQQIQAIFLQNKPHFELIWKSKEPNKGPFVSTDGQTKRQKQYVSQGEDINSMQICCIQYFETDKL